MKRLPYVLATVLSSAIFLLRTPNVALAQTKFVKEFAQPNSSRSNVFSYGHDEIRRHALPAIASTETNRNPTTPSTSTGPNPGTASAGTDPNSTTISIAADPGPSLPCVGGPPNYCANSTQDIIPETPMPPPAVNVPFRDPDFGSLMVRVTDANTRASYDGGYYIGISYGTDSSGEENEWGKLDPSLGLHGGYRFYVQDRGGNIIPFALDAATMTATRLTGQPGSYLNRRGQLDFGSPSFSYTNPDVLFGTEGTELVSYNFSTDGTTVLYDFNSCPGLPNYDSTPWLYKGGLANSGDDSKFTYYFGGTAQGNTTFVVYYDGAANDGAGACYWYDTTTATVGGTNMQPTPVAGGVGQLPLPRAPSVTANPGAGNLPAGNYYVRITALTKMNPQDGETVPSPEAHAYLPALGGITVNFPRIQNPDSLALPGRAGPSFNVYIGTSSGAEVLQNPAGPVKGAAYSQSAPLITRSAAPPTTNTAGYNVHNARMSKDGHFVRVDDQENDQIYFWKPGSNQVKQCNVACGGHLAMGYSDLINDPNNYDMAEVTLRPLSNLSAHTLLVKPLPSPSQWNDSHWSWNDADPNDTMPVCGSFYNSHTQGDGTQNVNTNPLLQITAPYDREIDCVATSGPSKVWRFAHNRA
ncbi:MAG: hypothetical protein ACRD10_04455, partial [Terriglobia bacterium]